MVDTIFEIRNPQKDLKLSELNQGFFSLETIQHLHSDAVDSLANALDKMFNISKTDTLSCVSTIEDSLTWQKISALKSEYIFINIVLVLLLVYLAVKLFRECRTFHKYRQLLKFKNRKRAE